MHPINGLDYCALVACGIVVLLCAGLLALFSYNERAIQHERIRARLDLPPAMPLLDHEREYRMNRGDNRS